MRTQLYAHNKTAYQKVMKAFETSDRTCVVHPTGTGRYAPSFGTIEVVDELKEMQLEMKRLEEEDSEDLL